MTQFSIKYLNNVSNLCTLVFPGCLINLAYIWTASAHESLKCSNNTKQTNKFHGFIGAKFKIYHYCDALEFFPVVLSFQSEA